MKPWILAALMLLTAQGMATAQEFSFDEFVGTWEGSISSENNDYDIPMTLVVEPDGFYTDSSGSLMPTIYPDTQMCEYEAETNRVHFWYLQTVYAGMRFYQHFYYEVVSYTGDTLEMHYNFWDDPEPHPEVQTITLVRAGTTGVGDGSHAMPARFEQFRSYPNPFNPRTTIEFAIAREAHVALKIYNLRGQEVATLAEGRLPAGHHQYDWDAAGLPGGVYMGVLTAGEMTEMRRLTLVK